MSQSGSGDFKEFLAALLAEIAANLKERRDFAGEDVIDVENIAAAQIGHSEHLSVGAALRNGPVVVRGEPVSPTPYVVEALAGAAFNNDGVMELLHELPGDHDAQLAGRRLEWSQDLCLLILNGGALVSRGVVFLLLNALAKIHEHRS